jgi:hypothetical protein
MSTRTSASRECFTDPRLSARADPKPPLRRARLKHLGLRPTHNLKSYDIGHAQVVGRHSVEVLPAEDRPRVSRFERGRHVHVPEEPAGFVEHLEASAFASTRFGFDPEESS